jgi:DNA repair protein RecN (Recombination protein N)
MMLVHLAITDFAIIKHLDLSLREGLTILSGETGAGKSIVINAINLILGGRSSADLIRTGCSEAVVEGLFALPEDPDLAGLLTDAGIRFDGELLIKRIISREDRNKIFINGALATLQTLSRLGPRLISIAGQYAHQLLLRPENHLYLLDSFSGLDEERRKLGALFDEHRSMKEEAASLEATIRSQRDREELARFQVQEIDMAGPMPGEADLLEEERRRLVHAEELLEIASSGYQTLYESEDGVLSSVAVCLRALEKGARIAPELAAARDSLVEIEARIEDVSFALRDFRESVEIDPQRLDQVVERLELLKGLKRKYGGTIEAVLRFKESLVSQISDLDATVQDLNRLNGRLKEAESELLKRAAALSRRRQAGAEAFRRAVEAELRQLHMKETRFRVRFRDPERRDAGGEGPSMGDMGPDGLDRIEFLISPNPGEELRPLSRIASGGELSRVMLAIRTILSRTASVETVIFDEVDAGISGATAEVVGEKIASLAAYHQIVCITHLPQIASQGDAHFVVKKEVAQGRTQAAIAELDPDARVGEIARLLGGRDITPRALAHAREMLERERS